MRYSARIEYRITGLIAFVLMAMGLAVAFNSSTTRAERDRNADLARRTRSSSKERLNAVPRSAGVAPVAGPFTVNTTNDTHAVTPSASALDSTGHTSLRSAIEAANAQGGTTTISVPPGAYNLSISPFELQVGSDPGENISIVGTGTPGNTIISQTAANNRVFDLDFNFAGDVIVSISNVTITGGVGDVFGGGGIVAGDPGDVLTVSNCVITANTTTATSNGGGISFSGGGDLVIQNGTVISNNSATQAVGGGIFFDNGTNPGNLTITNSTISNNTASAGAGAGQGGGVFIALASGSAGTITRSVLANNSAQTPVGQGGAIFVGSGFVVTNFCTITGNSAASGSGIFEIIGGGTVDAQDNWWGCNSGPGSSGGCSGTANGVQNVTVTSWLQLRASASPNTICPGASSAVTADIKGRNSSPALTTELNGLPPFPIPAATIFDNAVLGSVSGASTQFVDGVATATFTAGGITGAGGVDATSDKQTVTASITVQANTTTSPGDLAVCQGTTANFSTIASGPGPIHYAWTVDGSAFDGDSASISVPTGSLSVGSHPVAVTVTGACGSTTKNATLTVQANTATSKPSDQAVCQGSTASFSTTASGTAPFTFVWKKGLTVLHTGDFGGRVTITSGSNTSTLTIANAQPGDVGTYTVETTGTCGTATQSAALAVNSGPPTITLIGNAIELWPPNHSYHTIKVSDLVASASDSCDPGVNLNSVYITLVTSDELENGAGSGNTLNDIIILPDCKSVQLRAERETGGNGRVYTIFFKVKNAVGDFATASATVVVPKAQSGGGAIDSGPHYAVTSGCP